MNTTKITTFFASIALLSAVFVTPALADTNIRIAGNGSRSDNAVRVQENRNTTVRQTNDTNITNDVTVNNNTGHNSVSGNTGGDVDVRTGDATSAVNISNQAGMNVANIGGCCESSDTNIKIEGNGSKSDNSVNVSKDSDLHVTQTNDTNITNDVTVHNNTGHNAVDDNTWGDVTVRTGNANSDVAIRNEAGKNILDLNGCCTGGDTNVSIIGNGSRSDNNVWVNFNDNRTFVQDNNTDFDNNVDVQNNTGYNDASSDYWGSRHDKNDHGKKHKRDNDKGRKYFPFLKYHDYDRDYDKKDDHGKHDKKSYDKDRDHDKKYDHDKRYKKSHDKDYDHKKDRDHDRRDSKKHGRDYDKGKYLYPFVTYLKYGGHKKDYDRDHDKKFVSKKNDYDHKKDYGRDHDRNDHKKYDNDHKKVTYSKDRDRDHDYGKKRHGGKPYSFAKYPKFTYNHGNFCDNDRTDRYKSDNHRMKYVPFYGHGHGNTGGSVNLRTGDASSKVNLHNLGSSNYLSV